MKPNFLTLSIGGLLYSIMPSANAADPAQPISAIGEQSCITAPKTGACFGETVSILPVRSPLTAEPSIVVYGSNDTSANTIKKIDLLVAYTPLAEQEYANSGGIERKVRQAVANANDAYRNINFDPSKPINQRLCLVHPLKKVTYDEVAENTTLQEDLDRLMATNDGKMDGVHQARNQAKADLVTLIRKGPAARDLSICGVSKQLNQTNFGPTFESLAFSVIATHSESQNKEGRVINTIDCLENHTLAHEEGHNMGADHAHTNRYDPNPQGNGLFPDSLGLVYSSLCTIMATPLDSFPNSCQRVNIISQFKKSDYPFLDKDRNNAKALRKSSELIPTFRSNSSTLCDNGREIEDLSQVKTTTVQKSVTLYNRGQIPLSISAIKADAAWITAIKPSESLIPAGGSLVVQITADYKSAPVGVSQTSLQVFSNSILTKPFALSPTSTLFLSIPISIQKEDESLPTTNSERYAFFDQSSGKMYLHIRDPKTNTATDSEFVLTKHPTIPTAKNIFKLVASTPVRNQFNLVVPTLDSTTQTIDIPTVNIPTKDGMPHLFKTQLRLLPNLDLFEMLDMVEVKVPTVE